MEKNTRARKFALKPPRHPWTLLFAGIGLIFLSLWFRDEVPRIFAGINDFMGIYAASHLVGTPDEFDHSAYLREQIHATGWSAPSIAASSRLPALAYILRPVGKLKYRWAYALWQAMSLAALAVFFVTWPTSNRPLLLFAGCWSFPLFADVAGGQDLAFLLLILTVVWHWNKTRPLFAGAVLAFATEKYHLFLLLPIFLMFQHRWRMLAGASLVTGLILAACFSVAGPNWVPNYLNVISGGQTNPNVLAMPNLHGLFDGLPNALRWEVAVAILIALAVAWIATRVTFEVGFSVSMIGSLLTSHHAYPADMLLLLPMLLVLAAELPGTSVRLLCILLLSPLPFLYTARGPLAGPLSLLLVTLFLAVGATVAEKKPAPTTALHCAT